jgi:hypothetical protein
LLSHWSKAKFKSPCNFEEFLCRPHIFALWKCWYLVYWNLSYSLIILKVIFLKSNLGCRSIKIWSVPVHLVSTNFEWQTFAYMNILNVRTKILCHRNAK